MNLQKTLMPRLLPALIAVGVAGCYQYQPPAEIFEGTSFSATAHAETDKMLEGLSELSLERAQQIALINNPSIVSAYHAVNAAKMRYYQAIGQYSPTLNAGFDTNFGTARVSKATNGTVTDWGDSFSTNTSISANWLLFDGLAREFTMLQGRHALAQSQLAEEDAKRILMRAVTYAYYDILSAEAASGIARQDLKFQLQNLEETELKLEVGAVNLSDVLNFKIRVNAAQSNLIAATYNYEVAVYALAVLMGYPEGTLPGSVTFPKLPSTVDELVLSVDSYLDIALANRPDLKAYREAVTIAKYEEYKKYSAYSPTISAYSSMNFATSRSHTYPKGEVADDYEPYSYSARPNFTVGVSANWTLFNGFIRYNQMREAQASLAQNRYELANVWLTVVNEVRGSYANYLNQVKQAKLYAKTLQLVIKQRDLVQEEYRSGNCELTRLNEAETNLVSSQTDLINAMVNVYRAKAQLSAAVYGQIDTVTVPADPEYPDFMASISFNDPELLNIGNEDHIQSVNDTVKKAEY